MKSSIQEINSMTETDRLIKCRERLEEFHCENMDWTAVLADKWALVTLAQRGVK